MPPLLDEDRMSVAGLKGHWHRTLDLPEGYQHFGGWYNLGRNPNGVTLNEPLLLKHALQTTDPDDLYLYTQHEIFLDDSIIKHTRSSPNYEGGLVTYATCKHNMRTYTRKTWVGAWIAGLCPKDCADNTLLFAGRVAKEFQTNYDLSRYVKQYHRLAYRVKCADTNPRGDLYTPVIDRLMDYGKYNHLSFAEPENHTRSVEFYKKSPGSVSDREDGKIPKWHRDIEYIYRGNRPPCFILDPCYLFSKPIMWTSYRPKRAVLKITPAKFAASLQLRMA